MLQSLAQPNVQRAIVEIAALAVLSGAAGTWIVLRGIAFYAHAVGTATFPGLVVAAGTGIAAGLGAAAAAGVAAVLVARIARREGGAGGAATALVLVGALALGVVLASDVFSSPASVESALFGSLLLVSWTDVALAGAIAALAVVLDRRLGERWLAAGIDPETARAGGLRPQRTDAVLLGLTAAAAVAVLSAVGALLATAVLVVPAATARMLFPRRRPWQLATAGLTLVLGVVGLLAANALDLPPGPALAVLASAAFVLVAAGRALVARPRRGAAVAGAAAAAIALTGCGAGADDGGDRPSVLASTTQLGDIATNVAGPDADVETLLQPNSDPHEYEPRPRDVSAAAGADVVLESGLGLDDFVDEVVEQSGGDARVLDVGARVPHRVATGEGGEEHAEGDEHAEGEPHGDGEGHAEGEAHDHGEADGEGHVHEHGEEAAGADEEGHDHDHGPDDPHWWHDPRNGEAAAREIAGALAAADPANASAYRQRADRYVARLRSLDGAIGRCLSRIPEDRRRMVTNHDAFGHFAARYDVRVVGAVIPSTTTQAQGSVGDLAALRRTIAAQRVRAIFPETSLNPDVARRLAELTGADATRALYGDTLGPEGSGASTYLGMLRTNGARVADGLAGRDGACRLPAERGT